MTRFRTLALAALFVGTLTLAGGCGGDKVTASEVRRDMSPELYSVSQSRQQELNMIARSVDHTSRQFWDDLAWLMLLDRPLHLTEYPIP